MMKNSTSHKATVDFVDLLNNNTGKIFALPFFTALSQGLTTEQWRLYAKQFYISCVSFDKLLYSIVEIIRKTDYLALITELNDNFADEMGENSLEKIPHSVLRQQFFLAIGLPQTEMTLASNHKICVLPGTRNHTAAVTAIVEKECVYTQVGAFLAEEYMAAGPGFRLLESGVKNSFPTLATQNNTAMKYVYGHIECDEKDHFPNLLKATESLMAQTSRKQEIFAGAKAILDAELNLYNSFTHDILGLD